MKYIFCLLFCSCLLLQASSKGLLEYGTSGLPMIQVFISDHNGEAKPFRFLIDTGSNITAIDKSVASSLKLKLNKKARVEGFNGTSVETQEVIFRSISFGNYKFDNIVGVKLDLLNTLGQIEDGKFDGILGMDLLKNTIFILNFCEKYIEWNPMDYSNYKLANIKYTKTGLPLIAGGLFNTEFELLCDTGSTDYFTFQSKDIRIKLPLLPLPDTMSIAIGNDWKLNEEYLLDGNLTSGNAKWCNPLIQITNESDYSVIGMVAFGNAVYFDFKNNMIGFEKSPNNCQTILPIIRCPIALKWNYDGDGRRLIVLGVKPNSLYQTSGIQSGDIIVGIDNMPKKDLNIVNFRNCLNISIPHVIMIIRQNKFISIKIDSNFEKPQ